MRCKAAILGVALLSLVAGTANAGSNSIGLTGGMGVPTGDYSNAASTGWHIGATGTHMLNNQWGIGGDVGYHAWGGSKDANLAAETAFGPGSKFKWSAIQATAHAVIAFPSQSKVKPYATAGLGLYDVGLKLDTPTGNVSDSRNKLGFNVGAGMNIPTNGNAQWGVSGTYHIVPAKNDASLGADVDFFQVGLNVLWGVGK
jgi:hypothetical protein